MAPALAGRPHYRVVCADCGFPFACDAQSPPYRNLAVCPNCGYAENETPLDSWQSGNPVRIDRQAFLHRPPKRWEVVALASPDNEDYYNVKRVVGLPGETISIRRGDLYVNGEVVRKSLAELEQLAIVVHDDRYRPTKTVTLPARWQGASAGATWAKTSDGYACDATQSTGEPDWLEYRHWPCMASPLPRTREAAVLDNDSYNQAVSRELDEVRDLLLRCRLEAQGSGALYLRLHDGREWMEAKLPMDGSDAILRRSGLELARCRFDPRILRQGATIEFALCDGQALLAIGGERVFEQVYEAPRGELASVTRPAGIGVAGMAAQVSELRVLRDVHYLDPLGLGRAWSAEGPLGSDEYFVLGDNGPVSRDSRFWKPGSVTSKTLLGKVSRANW